MKDNFDACLAFTLHYEGFNSMDPNDPGGRTHKGVTQRVYDAYRHHHGLGRKDVYQATDTEVREIYLVDYWVPINGDQLPAGVDLAAFDYAVNSGVGRALPALRQYEHLSAHDCALDICHERLRFLHGLRTWKFFGHGWGTRVEACQSLALKMTGKANG